MSNIIQELCLERANTEKLRSVFTKYASVEKNGEKYMTIEDFLSKYLNIFPAKNFNQDSLLLFAGALKTKKSGLISFAEFQAFEGLLCLADAIYKIIFQLFDINGNGQVSFDECERIMVKTELYKHIPFDSDSPFFDLYFGKHRLRTIDYSEFTQFLHDLQQQYVIEAFRSHDNEGNGFITLEDFKNIMINTKKHLLTPEVESHLIETAKIQQVNQNVSFPYFIAFNSMLNNTELMKKIYLHATNGDESSEVTKENFLFSAQNESQVTPLQADILFKLCETIHGSNGKIVYKDFNVIAPEVTKEIVKSLVTIQIVSSPEDRGLFIQILESSYRFTLGSIAGAVGAAVVYPIDLVKTRMQNQRSSVGKVLYRNSFDCFKKVVKLEGIFGLYRGLVPQLMGVAPQKAINLTVNDFVRDKLMTKNGNITLSSQIIAGVCAGGSQVIFTNPLEIVKIRLQVAGEIAGGSKVRAWSVVKELGFFGLYKGAKACLLRDMPFSAIYFPTYTYTKAKLADETGYNHPLTLLLSGIIAGVPAAGLVTPADVIKTRLQVVARQGQTTYNGVLDATKKIYKEEGPRAFWKGTIARVIRSSPQFGVTLLTYEILQRLFYVDFGGTRPTGSSSKLKVKPLGLQTDSKSRNPDHIGGYQVATPIFSGIETKFGLCLPKFSKRKTT